jgi:hypothetical protein
MAVRRLVACHIAPLDPCNEKEFLDNNRFWCYIMAKCFAFILSQTANKVWLLF